MIRFKWYHTAATATTLRMSNLCFLHFFRVFYFVFDIRLSANNETKQKEQRKPNETRRNVTKRDVLNNKKNKGKKNFGKEIKTIVCVSLTRSISFYILGTGVCASETKTWPSAVGHANGKVGQRYQLRTRILILCRAATATTAETETETTTTTISSNGRLAH